MDFIKNFTFTPVNILKAIVVIVVSLFVIVFVFTLFGSVGGMRQGMNVPTASFQGFSGMSVAEVSYDSYAENTYGKVAPGSPSLSVRNTMPPVDGGGIGNRAEEFEVTDYSANIETRNKSRDCQIITELKPLDYVVFENSSEGDSHCGYVFKVKHEKVTEIIAIIKSLNPKDFSENTYSIKRQVDDFTSEIELLKKKIDSINKTMVSALRAYDEITALATRTQDASSLAKIIEGKIQIIQRLTDEGINASAQLERLSRAKAEQLDRVDYTYFRVNIQENKYVDWKIIKDSWKNVIRNFFFRVNAILQNSTVTVIVFVLTLIPYLIYLSILLFVAKYSWKFAKYIWQK